MNENSLAIKFPDISKEWHTTKNKDLTPFNVTFGTRKKVWWICGKGHEFEASIANRTKINGTNCPYCANQRPTNETCLETVNPKLSKEWHPYKNGDLTTKDVLPNGSQKVWWLCEKGHEWETTINKRQGSKENKGTGCPFCSGNKVNVASSLFSLKPDLIKQWHQTLNKGISPNSLSVGSNKKVWWLCDKGHEWESAIKSRTKGIGCPYCSGKLPTKENNLKAINPEIAKQWHPVKNSVLPENVLPQSNKKAWWICEKGHEWNAVICSRTRGNGCPKCSEGLQTSFPELAIFFYIKKIFKKTIHRYKPSKRHYEIDIYIPEINVGIEYDGSRFHKDINKDLKKEIGLRKNNELLTFYRVREKRCPDYPINNPKTFIIKRNGDYHDSLEESINLLLEHLHFHVINIEIDFQNKFIDIKRDEIDIRSQINQIEAENSLLNKNPNLSKEWHPTKNRKLKPSDFSHNSSAKVWWICENGHEFNSVIGNRNKGVGCPYCSGNKASKENSLATFYPELTAEWHPTKNIITPNQVTKGSGKNVWWICKNGHEWEQVINKRVKGSKCPHCKS